MVDVYVLISNLDVMLVNFIWICVVDFGGIFVIVVVCFLFMIRFVVSFIVNNFYCFWRFYFIFWFFLIEYFLIYLFKMIFYFIVVVNDIYSFIFGGFVGLCIIIFEICVFFRWLLFRFWFVVLFFLLFFLRFFYFFYWFCVCGGDFIGKSFFFNLSWIFVGGFYWLF